MASVSLPGTPVRHHSALIPVTLTHPHTYSHRSRGPLRRAPRVRRDRDRRNSAPLPPLLPQRAGYTRRSSPRRRDHGRGGALVPRASQGRDRSRDGVPAHDGPDAWGCPAPYLERAEGRRRARRDRDRHPARAEAARGTGDGVQSRAVRRGRGRGVQARVRGSCDRCARRAAGPAEAGDGARVRPRQGPAGLRWGAAKRLRLCDGGSWVRAQQGRGL